MGEEEMTVARRAIDHWVAGERDEAWALWSDDCVGIPPREFPEPGPWQGREKLRSEFESWDTAFGPEWTTHLEVRAMTDLGDGRVLIELEFKSSGVESGLPVDQQLAVLQTFAGGRVVKGEFFMNWAESRQAAGLA